MSISERRVSPSCPPNVHHLFIFGPVDSKKVTMVLKLSRYVNQMLINTFTKYQSDSVKIDFIGASAKKGVTKWSHLCHTFFIFGSVGSTKHFFDMRFFALYQLSFKDYFPMLNVSNNRNGTSVEHNRKRFFCDQSVTKV